MAAWDAYALQTYGDKLLANPGRSHGARFDTRAVADACHRLAAECIARAEGEADGDGLLERLPRWRTPVRDAEQLRGMREALEALRIHVAYDLDRLPGDATQSAGLRDELALVDEKLATVDLLWIEHPPPEIRGGIGDALVTGLDRVCLLGRRLAAGET